MLSACTGGGATGSTSPRGPPSCDQTSLFSDLTCYYLLFLEFLNFNIESSESIYLHHESQKLRLSESIDVKIEDL